MSNKSSCYQSTWTPGKNYLNDEDLRAVQLKEIPSHVAIIMDGNRRWAKDRAKGFGSDFLAGHWAGARALTEIVAVAQAIGIKVLTVWAFSTENWNRPKVEVEMLMHIFEVYLRDNRQKLVEAGVRFHVIGDLSAITSSHLLKAIEKTTEETKDGKTLDFIVGFNYGGRNDIKRALVRLIKDVEAKKIAVDAIDEKCIGAYLDTARWPDPDLLIRTSAELRISNFLLWQIAYSELYTTDVLWPDFRAQNLLEAVVSYQKRDRRMGR